MGMWGGDSKIRIADHIAKLKSQVEFKEIIWAHVVTFFLPTTVSKKLKAKPCVPGKLNIHALPSNI